MTARSLRLLKGANRRTVQMVYLIGVNHDLSSTRRQTSQKSSRGRRAEFKAHVLEVIERLGISILAEEFSDEAKTKWRVSESTLEQLGKAKGIEHRFVALLPVKEKKMFEQSDSDKREQFWLSQIQGCKNKNVLFVYGDDHLQVFC